MDHTTPCTTLEQIMEDIKKHERELGGIGSSMGMLLDGQKKIFRCIDDLSRIAIRNETNIKNIKDAQDNLADELQNGLKTEIAKTVVEHAKDPEGGLAVEKRFQEIEKIMWLPRMLDTRFKKLVVAALTTAFIVGLVLLTAFATAKMWGYFKETKWGETPGLMQQIDKNQGVLLDKNTHTHYRNGNTVVETHDNPDGPLINGGNNRK